MNNRGFFYGWKGSEKFAFFLITALAIAGAFFLTIPIGMAFMIWLLAITPAFHDPMDMSNPSLGAPMPGTMPYKVASFFRVMKKDAYGSHIFSPTVLIGFGPPEDDTDKDLRQSMFIPPARLSAWWAALSGISLGYIDNLVRDHLHPIWGSAPLPVPISWVISALGWFMFLQAMWAAWRYYLASEKPGVEFVPAVMVHKIPQDGTGKKAIIKGAISTGVAAVVLVAIYGILFSVDKHEDIPLSTVQLIICATALAISVGIFVSLRMLTEKYREEFETGVANREKWNGIFEYKKNKAPFFAVETPVPAVPGKPGGPPEGEDPGEAHVFAATFSYPMNGTWEDFAGEADNIRTSLPEAEMLAIIPVPKQNPKTGKKMSGTVSPVGFRIWWSDEYFSIKDMLKHPDNYTPEHKEVAVRALITDRVGKIKKIGPLLVHSYNIMTTEKSSTHIMEVKVVPKPGVTVDDFLANASKISAEINLPWVRAGKTTTTSGVPAISLYVGTGGPTSQGIEFPPAPGGSRIYSTLQAADWAYVFYINKVTSPDGAPDLLMAKPATEESHELIFDLPPGINYKVLEKAAEPIKTSSGNIFLEIHPGVTGEKKLARREKRQLERYKRTHQSVSQFTITAAKTHPLEKVFYFKDYMDELVPGRQLGKAHTSWSPGVRSNGSLGWHSFQGDDPHLIIAGSSGSGKSVLIYSFIAQILANNDPRDSQVWICDPKIGYKMFKGIDGVTNYVDSWTPNEGHFYENVRDMFHAATKEMERRNTIFNNSGANIDKLSVARSIGFDEGPLPDGSPNPLVQPYLYIVIDECANLFAGASDKETKALQADILYYACRLARESRSAGIAMLNATQYPVKENLNTTLKQQSGRIGLSTRDSMASKVIIDQPGLEELWIKGTGKQLDGRELFDFRGYLMNDHDKGISTMDDILDSLPKRDDADDNKLIGSSSDTGDKLVDMPDFEDSVFHSWENSPWASDARKRIEDGAAEKVASAVDSISEEEFNAMSQEQFRKIILDKV